MLFANKKSFFAIITRNKSVFVISTILKSSYHEVIKKMLNLSSNFTIKD